MCENLIEYRIYNKIHREWLTLTNANYIFIEVNFEVFGCCILIKQTNELQLNGELWHYYYECKNRKTASLNYAMDMPTTIQ